MSEFETFSPEEWSVINSALFRYRRLVEEHLADEERSDSERLALVRRTEQRVRELTGHSASIEATVVKPAQQRYAPPRNPGRWGQGGPGSDDYFSFAD